MIVVNAFIKKSFDSVSDFSGTDI